MATGVFVNRGTRSMLETTLQTIQQLKQSEREHLEQQAEILKHITSLELKLKEAKKQNMETLASLAAITQSLAQMQVVERNLRAAISPMKHLPEDVLLHLFRIIAQELDVYLDKKAARWSMTTNSYRCTLLRLSGVCTRWRGVIMENFSLTTTVEIRLTQAKEEARNRERQLVTNWMKPAKTRDRKLLIYGWNFADREYLQALLGPGPAEWRAIHIALVDDRVDDAMWDVGAHSAREVTILRRGAMNLTYFTQLIRHASVVVLYGPPPQWGSLPWIRLRSLTIRNFTGKEQDKNPPLSFGSAEFTALLMAATELTCLVLDFYVQEANLATEESPSIKHRNLEYLSLHLQHFVVGKGPFSVQLNAPSLRTLDFVSLRCKASVDAVPFVCQWDDPRILSLPSMADEEVLLAAELIKWLPNVHALQVMGRNVDALFTFIHSLLHHTTPLSLPLPVPKLSSLFITDTDLRGATLIELLESRLRHVQGNTSRISAITNIKMYNSPAVTPENWSRVQELLIEGIGNPAMITGDGMEG